MAAVVALLIRLICACLFYGVYVCHIYAMLITANNSVRSHRHYRSMMQTSSDVPEQNSRALCNFVCIPTPWAGESQSELSIVENQCLY